MNTQNNTLFFDYKDKNCNYCPVRLILDQFKNYTESPGDCERLRNYIATEIGHTKPSYTSQLNSINQRHVINSAPQQSLNANQQQQINPNNQKPYSIHGPPIHYNSIPGIDLKRTPIHKYNQSDPNSVLRSNGSVKSCNNDEYICFKISSPLSPPILIEGPLCQTNCKRGCIQHSCNQVANPQQQLKNQRLLTQVNKTVKNPTNRRKQTELCNRKNCVHKTPESVCLYGQPCKAHCFNTPPGAERRNGLND